MQKNKSKCLCPYCNYTISYDMPFCRRCEVEFIICEKCEELIRKEEEICPHCSSDLKCKNER